MVEINSKTAQLGQLNDAVHGYIDLIDAHSLGGEKRIEKLVRSEWLQRLRRLRQLFFVPQTYLSADHTRYAHSIGTMHMMRCLIKHLKTQNPSWDGQVILSLNEQFPGYFDTDEASNVLEQHLLTAALLLDIGELPFGQATKHLYRLSPDSLDLLQKNCQNFEHLNQKQLRTLLLFKEDKESDELLKGYCLDLLRYLITGADYMENRPSEQIQLLRQMLDGVVDVDRLDYVYRDAHHTVGQFGNPLPVIQSILGFDENGVIVKDPLPVSMFLTQRAYMHAHIYLFPAVRFRTVILVRLLKEIWKRVDSLEEELQKDWEFSIGAKEFHKLDDEQMNLKLRRLQESDLSKRKLGENGKKSLDLYFNQVDDYEYLVLSKDGLEFGDRSSSKKELPEDVYVDSMNGQFREVYFRESIRVDGGPYRTQARHLESSPGPLEKLFQPEQYVTPIRSGDVMLFYPSTGDDGGDISPDELIKIATAQYDNILIRDFESWVGSLPADTRTGYGYQNDRKSIFVSWESEDEFETQRILQALAERKRRYHCLIGGAGTGQPPRQNSIQAAREAESAVLLISASYCEKLKNKPNGNLSAELEELGRRHSRGEIPVTFLALDKVSSIADEFSWGKFGFDTAPFMHKALRGSTDVVRLEYVDNILSEIDRFGSK